MINIVLFQPEIPQNTGNIIRLAANTGSQLHLVRPLGFDLEDKRLRRAGLDYHEYAAMQVHENWEVFLSDTRPERLFGLSTKGRKNYADIVYKAADFVVFGPETRGLPSNIRAQMGPNCLLRLPMLPASRSLNLSNAAAIPVLLQPHNWGFSTPVVFRSKAQCAANGRSPWQALQRGCGTPQECPVGCFVSAHGLRCTSWQG